MADFKALKIGDDTFTVKDDTARYTANSAYNKAVEAWDKAGTAKTTAEDAYELAGAAEDKAEVADQKAADAQDAVNALETAVGTTTEITGITYTTTTGSVTSVVAYRNNNVVDVEVKFRNATNPVAVGKVAVAGEIHGLPAPALEYVNGMGSYPISSTYQYALGNLKNDGTLSIRAITQLTTTTVDRRVTFSYVCGSGTT